MNENTREKLSKQILAGVIANFILLAIASGFAFGTNFLDSWVDEKIEASFNMEKENRQKIIGYWLKNHCKDRGDRSRAEYWYRCPAPSWQTP